MATTSFVEVPGSKDREGCVRRLEPLIAPKLVKNALGFFQVALLSDHAAEQVRQRRFVLAQPATGAGAGAAGMTAHP